MNLCNCGCEAQNSFVLKFIDRAIVVRVSQFFTTSHVSSKSRNHEVVEVKRTFFRTGLVQPFKVKRVIFVKLCVF